MPLQVWSLPNGKPAVAGSLGDTVRSCSGSRSSPFSSSAIWSATSCCRPTGRRPTRSAGSGRNRESRRALISHTLTYTAAFIPALIWIGLEIGAGWAVGVGALVAIPHLLQDDGRALDAYMREVKESASDPPPGLRLAVDQTGHFIALFLLALLTTV